MPVEQDGVAGDHLGDQRRLPAVRVVGQATLAEHFAEQADA
ncbi:hypothetical protein ACFZCT_30905 [Streptomyces qaidamensis]|jgi:hypothetical protein